MPSRRARFTAALILAVIALAGCATGTAPGPSSSPTIPPPTPTPVPGASGGSTGSGNSGSNGGGSVVGPGGPGGGDVLAGQAKFVVPIRGQLDLHPVSVQGLRASVDGRDVKVELRWWSGVAPCSVLDSVTIERDEDAQTIRLTAVEGHGPQDVACIDIAQLTATIVDLGELAPGGWVISATGDAAPLTVEVR